MSTRNSVFVEVIPETGNIIRIIKPSHEAYKLPPERVRMVAKKYAVGEIRRQVVDNARRGNLIRCKYCGKVIPEGGGHMHEDVPKGNGGEVSVENSVLICADCHIGPDGEHGDRRWQSALKNGIKSG